MSCHPGPALAVTVVATLLAVAAGAPAGTVVLVAAAFGVGQLSIGWSNDWLDAARDVAGGRTDKPGAAGAVSAAVGRRGAGGPGGGVGAPFPPPWGAGGGPAPPRGGRG